MSRSTRQYLVLGSGVVVLGVAAILQGIKVKDVVGGDQSAKAQPIKLTDQVPRNLSGWAGRDEPLGPNEVTRTAVERTLNYDDFVFRVFEKDGKQIGVYVAYWTAGRMPLQKVASHTPDRCWTENGWRCEEMRFAETLTAGEARLLPAQWRRFTPPNGAMPQYVVYWHLVGTRLYDYGTRFNARPDFVKWWRDTLDYAFSGSEAQYFIRVTSNRPFEEFAREPAWAELVEALGKLGLESKEQGAKR
jgi:hypothetical protein